MFVCNPLLNSLDLSRLKTVIFDCDGVLFDSRDVNIRFYNRIKDYFGLDPMSREEEEYVHMHSVRDSLEYILPQQYHSRLPEVREHIKYSEMLPYMRMEDGVSHLLELLLQKRVRMAINTNRSTTMNLLLQRFGLQDYFWPVITAGHVSRPKPHPESLHKIMELCGLHPEETVFIGDSVVDQETALGAGVSFWGYKNEYLKGDMFIPDFWTLREFLARKL